jgi:hypothetical protein
VAKDRGCIGESKVDFRQLAKFQELRWRKYSALHQLPKFDEMYWRNYGTPKYRLNIYHFVSQKCIYYIFSVFKIDGLSPPGKKILAPPLLIRLLEF